MTLKWLCKLGWHRWDFVSPDALAMGSFSICRRCGVGEYMSFPSGYSEIIPAARMKASLSETPDGSRLAKDAANPRIP